MKGPQLVWRMEDEEGGGIYGPNFFLCEPLSGRADRRRPIPAQDGLSAAWRGTEIRHGFSTYQKLLSWFNIEELKEFVDCPVTAYVTLYLAKEVAKGKKQVQFQLPSAVCVMRVPVPEFAERIERLVKGDTVSRSRSSAG